ncbi:MAG: ABC transporter permease [Gemmatimonadaceae bacterium]
MRALFPLIRKELIVLRRDWHALLLLFAMPTLFILLMSLALRDKFAEGAGAPFTIFIVNHDTADALSDTLAAGIRAQQSFHDLGAGMGVQQDADLVRKGKVQFLVVIPDGFARAVAGADPKALEVSVSPDADRVTALLFSAVVRESVSRLYMKQAMAPLVRQFGALIPQTAPINGIPAGAMDKMITQRSLYADGVRALQPTSVQQNVPAWLVFAMFFVALPLSTTWLQERRQGTFTRLRSLGLSPLHLLLGKLVPYYVINLVQVVLMLAVGLYVVPLFGGDALTLGHSTAGLAVMALAVSFAAVSYALLIANLVSTVEQATILTGVTNLVLAAVGGVMVPRFVMPLAMQRMSMASPMAWGLEGFLDIFLRDGNVATVAPKALLLFGFGAASLLFAGVALRRTSGR